MGKAGSILQLQGQFLCTVLVVIVAGLNSVSGSSLNQIIIFEIKLDYFSSFMGV